MRAHLTGAIDFRQARVQDRRWWLRSAMLLAAIERDTHRQTIEARLQYLQATIGSGAFSGERQGEALEGLLRQLYHWYNELHNELTPWDRQSIGDLEKGQRQRDVDEYKQWCGDPRDPEFQKKIAQDVAMLRERGDAAEAARQETLNRMEARRPRRHGPNVRVSR